MPEINHFKTDLAFSNTETLNQFWHAFYRATFADLTRIENCANDRACQKVGIDRKLHLSTGKILRVDEKCRREVFPDIALEWYHEPEYGNGWKGWIDKDMQLDYIAYAFLPSSTVYLFPWQALQAAWDRYALIWYGWALERKYGFSTSTSNHNRDYKTHNLCVPIAVLQQAIEKVQNV